MKHTPDRQDSVCCGLPPSGDTAAESATTGAALFKALSDPTRLGILKLLATQGEPVCVCHITPHFDLNQPTISHHLRLLREAGLVAVSRRGTWAYYSPRREAIEHARRELDGLAPLDTAV